MSFACISEYLAGEFNSDVTGLNRFLGQAETTHLKNIVNTILQHVFISKDAHNFHNFYFQLRKLSLSLKMGFAVIP